MAQGTRIDSWKTEEVRRYLEKQFTGYRIEDYPRGANVAHLFAVTEPGVSQRRQKQQHYLLVTRQFFDRFTDSTALKEALVAADVAKALERGGDRTVELY